MATLREYLETNPDGHKVDAYGIIRDLGRMQGESLATAYFEDVAGNGCSDERGEGWDAFKLDDDERAALHAFDGGDYSGDAWYLIHYSDSGFISGETGTDAEFMAFLDRMNDAAEDADEESPEFSCCGVPEDMGHRDGCPENPENPENSPARPEGGAQ